MASARRLAAILAADVVGYSRLIGADEEGTHERVKAHLGELIDPKIREHHGRIVKTTGDGVLAEFASVVDAVRYAAASPGLPIPRSRLAAACALRGETERAAAELAEVRRLSGGDLFSSIAHLKAHPCASLGVPKTRALYEATYFARLRKAGMPEE